MTDVAQIVAKLTQAQRDLVLIEGRQTVPVAWSDIAVLHALDLFEHRHTPLGLAVRTALVSKDGESADA